MTKPENPINEEQIKEFLLDMDLIAEKVGYREINMESWYHELLDSTNRSEEEEILFLIMTQTREFFMQIDKGYNERMTNMHELIQKTAPNVRVGIRYYDWDSRPIQQWEYHFKQMHFPKHVGEDFINGWRISTVWLGLDLSFFKDSVPIIFETMIFKEDENISDDEELDCYQERYSYLYQAEIGHKNACDVVRNRKNTIS